jgi:hypothetical protein
MLILVAILAGFTLPGPDSGSGARAQEKKGTKRKAAKQSETPGTSSSGDADLNSLYMEIQAQRTLFGLKVVNPPQVRRLMKLAESVTPKERHRETPEVTDPFREALNELRTALVQNNADKVSEIDDRLDELNKNGDIEFDDTVDVTEAAREAAPKALALLRADQVASYLGSLEDEFPSPQTLLLRSMRLVGPAGKKAPPDQWKEERDEVSRQIGWLVAGLDQAKADEVASRAAQLLDKAYAAKRGELLKQRVNIEKEIHSLLGDVGPIEVIRHIMEHDLAEMLSNPRVTAALKSRLGRAKQPS